MLIVSRFHDYYDSAIGIGGVDKTVVYTRKEDDLREKKRSLREFSSFRYQHARDRYEVYIEPFAIGFCGEIHKGLGFHIYQNMSSKPTLYRYSYESALKMFQELGIELTTIKNRYDFNFGSSIHINNLNSLKKFFSSDSYGSSKEYLEAFIKYKVPVFYLCYDDDNIVLNPCLKTYGFQAVKDPFTAFQEIHGYISGVLGVDARPMVELSDESKIEKHGFFKWSFRKEPWKKSQKKNPTSK